MSNGVKIIMLPRYCPISPHAQEYSLTFGWCLCLSKQRNSTAVQTSAVQYSSCVSSRSPAVHLRCQTQSVPEWEIWGRHLATFCNSWQSPAPPALPTTWPASTPPYSLPYSPQCSPFLSDLAFLCAATGARDQTLSHFIHRPTSLPSTHWFAIPSPTN